jgi:exopolysaccharide biosynthesis protein
VNQKYFNKSVRYIREISSSPRKMITHVFVIDLKYPKLHFLVTPPDHNQDAAPVCGRTTSEFLERHGVQIAINGDGYTYVNPASVSGVSCPEGRDLFNPNSYAASRGKVYSQRMNASRPIMYINSRNIVTYNKPQGAVYNAISGDRTLVEKGKTVAGLDSTTLQPRTAIGTNQNGRWMVMIVVDGRQPGYSEGCTLQELADMLIKFGGVYDAINLDGGGSSAMVIEKDGVADILNSPIEGGIAGKERNVANHLGIEIR